MLNDKFYWKLFKVRSQSTVISNVVSGRKNLNDGIPQGCCFGPLLFIVYIKYLFSARNNKLRLFADDACLSFQHCDIDHVNVLWIWNWRKLINGGVKIDCLLII